MRSGLLTLRAAGLVAAVVAVPVLATTAADAHDSVKATVTPSPVRPGAEVKIKVTGCENPRAGAARSDVFVADSELGARRGGDRKSPLQGEAKVKSSAKDGRYAVDVWCDGHEHGRAAVFEVDHDPKPSAKPETKSSAKPSARTSASASAKPKPKPKPKASASITASEKPETKPKPESRTSATAKASAKPEAKLRPTSARPSAKPETKPESKPESKPKPAPTDRQPLASQPRSPGAHADPGEHHASPVAPVRAGGGGRTISTAAADEAGPSTPHTVIGLVLAGVAAVAVAIRSARRKRSAARDSD
ncbi:hypothetical protein SSPS47_11165 [Streptomyces sp. S4.7]|uniref:hypothetical protein n=1 Tax=Streptomyces sp. S4.7 TaxID=2705439 RepID=UPI001397FBF5|nr:hypothetical protein [Streptomyces sp. S4.7]QHY95677.1 hypothetical protein SSPS47_11165 [Streptomyces sp. S4.7]